MQPFIKISGLVFMDKLKYPELIIPQYKTSFLAGASGSGKSTLFKLINATLSPSSGTIEYNGTDTATMDTIGLRRELLLASQDAYLFEGTIKQNFEMYYAFRDNLCITEAGMRKYLYLCCVDFALDTPCKNLSGGEKQRVFMAICMSFTPKLLMLDEPTAALDEKTARRFFGQVKAYCAYEQITLAVICHSPLLIEEFADNILTLGEGAEE